VISEELRHAHNEEPINYRGCWRDKAAVFAKQIVHSGWHTTFRQSFSKDMNKGATAAES
jgi:hypothetical protein